MCYDNSEFVLMLTVAHTVTQAKCEDFQCVHMERFRKGDTINITTDYGYVTVGRTSVDNLKFL